MFEILQSRKLIDPRRYQPDLPLPQACEAPPLTNDSSARRLPGW